jgi:type II secretory pathway pseudopilin PulG
MRSQAAVISVLCAVLVPAFAQQSPQANQRMYKCTDARGKTYYTQVPPRECLGRETTEMSKSGTVVQKSARAPTTAEVQAHEAERKKKAEEEMKAKEERRKNTALLNTYSSEKDIEDQRARALKEAQDAIAASERAISGAQKRQQQLESEKEFYVKKPMPLKLKNEISNVDNEIKNQTGLLEAKKKEISSINAKYDEDKRRYIELTAATKK